MNDTRTATLRTTWNGTLLALLIMVANSVFDWDLTVEDLLPYTPILAAAIGVFYRLSLFLSQKWPKVFWILFGKNTTPTYASPTPPAD